MISRDLQKDIQNWISGDKRALLVTGARQTGKTFLIRETLKSEGIPYVEFNFIDQPDLVPIFNQASNAKDLLLRISVMTEQRIEPGKTVFFLDEIQEVDDMVTRIKFLVDDGQYRFIMSGSLLGVELNDIKSAPVGYLKILEMYPVSFREFAGAAGIQEDIFGYLQNCFDKRLEVDDVIHRRMLDLFYLYLIVGGMPDAVQRYLDTNNIQQVNDVQTEILRLYKRDFTKYEKNYSLKLKEIYDAIPSELNEKNKRFRINVIGKGLDYDKKANDFLWLKDAGIALPVYNVTEPRMPLEINSKRSLFKLFMSDVGLLTSQYSSEVRKRILMKSPDINNGALFENAVAEELKTNGFDLYYYNSKKQGEVDLLIEYHDEVLPVEVKSGKDYKRHSALKNILSDSSYGIEEAVVLSDYNCSTEGKITYLPVYMTMFIVKSLRQDEFYHVDVSDLKVPQE